MYITTNIAPCNLVVFPERTIGKAIIVVIKISVGIVNKIKSFETLITSPAEANTEHAINNVQSIMLAPKIFPIPISGLSNFTEVKVVTSSGMFVPIAIITKLTTPLFTPIISLIASTFSTKTIAPSPIANAEITNSTIILAHESFNPATSVVAFSVFASRRFISTNPTSIKSKTTASTTPITPFIPKTNKATTHTRKYTIFDKKPLEDTLVGHIKKDIPRTMVKLQTVEPMAVFMPISSTPLKLEISDTVVSGKVVAILTIVAPTIMGGIFALLASLTEEDTKMSPPFNISTKPNINIIIVNAFPILNNMKFKWGLLLKLLVHHYRNTLTKPAFICFKGVWVFIGTLPHPLE